MFDSLDEGTVVVFKRKGELYLAEIFSYEEDYAYDEDVDAYVAGYSTLQFGFDNLNSVLTREIIKVLNYKGEEEC